MIRFSQFLAEARMAPLYHGTDEASATKILKSNTLRASGSVFDGVAISFTRSLALAKQHPDYNSGASLDEIVVFEVDQTKLIQNYRVKPYNFFSTKTRFTTAKPMENTEGWNEYEERIVNRDVKDFNKYIIKIHVFVPPGKPIKGNLILNHPKLWYNGKFVNK